MLKIFALVIALALFVGCSDKDEPAREELSIAYVKEKINTNMTYDQLVSSFGEPEKDMGSGIHIYVYTMPDATEVWIGFTDKILYANHIDQDQKIISVII